MENKAIDPVTLEVIWNRFMSVANEQQDTLIRTAFSTIVRESQDLACGLFDTKGRMIAQSLSGTPGHINAMATSMKHFLAAFPPDKARAGRCADHQRSLADRGTDQRHHDHHADFSQRQAGRAVRQHLPQRRYRRADSFRRSARSFRRGAAHSDHETVRARRAESKFSCRSCAPTCASPTK